MRSKKKRALKQERIEQGQNEHVAPRMQTQHANKVANKLAFSTARESFSPVSAKTNSTFKNLPRPLFHFSSLKQILCSELFYIDKRALNVSFF